MTLQLVNTIAMLGTFLVIGATAVAAIVQLRHARCSNHIAALNELRETIESPRLGTLASKNRCVATGRRSKKPAIFATELRRAVVTDGKADLGNIDGVPDQLGTR